MYLQSRETTNKKKVMSTIQKFIFFGANLGKSDKKCDFWV